MTYVKAGYFDETDDVVGIAHVLEHMYFKGTPTRGVGEIARETKAAGGYLNAATIYDRVRGFLARVQAEDAANLPEQADASAAVNSSWVCEPPGDADSPPEHVDAFTACVQADSDEVRKADSPEHVDAFTACVRSIEAGGAAASPDTAPSTPLFNTLRAEGCPPAILAETARRAGEQNLWKEKYIRKIVANLLRDAARPPQQPMSLLSPTPGESDLASMPSPLRRFDYGDGMSFDDLVEKNTRLWGEHVATRGAVGGLL